MNEHAMTKNRASRDLMSQPENMSRMRALGSRFGSAFPRAARFIRCLETSPRVESVRKYTMAGLGFLLAVVIVGSLVLVLVVAATHIVEKWRDGTLFDKLVSSNGFWI